MTTQEKAQVIREACIKANPSILDLVLGCEIRHPIGSGDGIIVSHCLTLKTKSDTFLVLKKNSTFYLTKDAIKEIIGRPIRLADVLLAIPCEKYTGFHDGYLEVGDDNCKWNLKDDNLDNQSPETIDFIHSLLCNA